MRQPETRALWSAVGLLVLVSAGRLAWSSRVPGPASGEESVLPELLATSRAGAVDAARRAEPLADGELIDPNRASETELDRLPGVGPATARAIAAARERGLVIRRPEDLLAVRGIGETTLERMQDALELSAPPARGPSVADVGPSGPGRAGVNVNRAGVEELQSLPGIGPALAERIVVAREQQTFTSLDDLVRVRGIGKATIERLRPHASVGLTTRRGPG